MKSNVVPLSDQDVIRGPLLAAAQNMLTYTPTGILLAYLPILRRHAKCPAGALVQMAERPKVTIHHGRRPKGR